MGDQQMPLGTLLLIGAMEKAENISRTAAGKTSMVFSQILDRFLRLTAKPNPVIEILTSPDTKDPVAFYWNFRKILESIQPCSVNHIHQFLNEKYCMPGIRERISRADGFFIADGNLSKICATYGGSELFMLIKRRYISDKIVIAGYNAGAMALSTILLPKPDGKDQNPVTHPTAGCLELLCDICVDTCFLFRGRINHMAKVLAVNPKVIGISIYRNTALIIKRGMETMAIGYGSVVFSSLQNTRKNYRYQILVLSNGEKYTIKRTGDACN